MLSNSLYADLLKLHELSIEIEKEFQKTGHSTISNPISNSKKPTKQIQKNGMLKTKLAGDMMDNLKIK